MLAVVAAVLALAGAPASTPFACVPAIQGYVAAPGTRAVGLTTWHDDGTADVQVVGSVGCAALLYAGASPFERAALRRLNPSIDFDWTVGAGLLVDLHEAYHVAFRDPGDECRVERAALDHLPALLASFPVVERSEILRSAEGFDQAARASAGCS
jgi:hypothetical protein